VNTTLPAAAGGMANAWNATKKIRGLPSDPAPRMFATAWNATATIIKWTGISGETGLTKNQYAVLGFLSRGWKLRLRRSVWLLKQPDYVDRFEECPGGATTLKELTVLGYLDERNNLTTAGKEAFAAAAPQPGSDAGQPGAQEN